MRWTVVVAPLGVVALVVLLTTTIPSQTILMEDQSMDADSIEMDHNAMLANDPSKNAAFLKAFSSYLPAGQQQQSRQLQSAKGTTQLAQESHEKHRAMTAGAEARLNAKLAKSMQSRLTAASKGDELMTPHFVAALDAASHMAAKQTMLASSNADARREEHQQVMDAMTMAEKGSNSHLLPAALREKYAFTKTKKSLGSTEVVTPQEAALESSPSGVSTMSLSARPNPTGSGTGDAAKADSSFLAASEAQQPVMTAKQLIQQAALRQMNSLQSNALASASPARPQQLAAQPAAIAAPMPAPAAGGYSPGMAQLAQMQGQPAPAQKMYQQPQQSAYQQPVYSQAPTQQMYQPAPTYQQPQQMYQQPQQMYQQPQQAPTQQMYQQPPQYGYGYAPPAGPNMFAQTQMAYQQPQYQAQQPQQPQMYAAPAQTQDLDNGPLSESAQPQAAPGHGPPPNWRAPDVALKQGGNVIGMSTAQKAKVKQQMMALRSQIEDDFKHNTKMGDTALLMGPDGL